MTTREDEWLWGWDETPGIVSVWAEPDGRAFVWRRRPDGSLFEALISASRIGDTLQEKRIVIVYEDITDRRRAEESYKLFASSSQAGVYVVQDGMFQYVNHHAAAYAGYSAEELAGMNSMGLVHPEDRVKVRK